jgi:hypothetical protein
MTWAPIEVQKAIYETLANDTQLQPLITGVFDSAAVPQNQEFPYVTINPGQLVDRSSHTHRGFETQIQIDVWDQSENWGRKRVQLIQKEIDRLLHDVTICIEGWNIISLRQIQVEAFVDIDNVTMHGVQRFKLMIGEA